MHAFLGISIFKGQKVHMEPKGRLEPALFGAEL